MRIACFWTELHPACEKTLPPGTELVWTGASDTAYWEQLSARWDGSDDLLVIEHDMELHDQVVPQLEACPGDWCVFPYDYPGWVEGPSLITGALGCTRFSASLQREYPIPLIAATVSRADHMPPEPLWHYCDLYIRRALTRAGLKQCEHWPLVTHHRGRV